MHDSLISPRGEIGQSPETFFSNVKFIVSARRWEIKREKKNKKKKGIFWKKKNKLDGVTNSALELAWTGFKGSAFKKKKKRRN